MNRIVPLQDKTLVQVFDLKSQATPLSQKVEGSGFKVVIPRRSSSWKQRFTNKATRRGLFGRRHETLEMSDRADEVMVDDETFSLAVCKWLSQERARTTTEAKTAETLPNAVRISSQTIVSAACTEVTSTEVVVIEGTVPEALTQEEAVRMIGRLVMETNLGVYEVRVWPNEILVRGQEIAMSYISAPITPTLFQPVV